MKVSIPQPLRAYTGKQPVVEADGTTVDEQDAIRRHIRIFVNREQVRGIDVPLSASDEVQIFQALSGG